MTTPNTEIEFAIAVVNSQETGADVAHKMMPWIMQRIQWEGACDLMRFGYSAMSSEVAISELNSALTVIAQSPLPTAKQLAVRQLETYLVVKNQLRELMINSQRIANNN